MRSLFILITAFFLVGCVAEEPADIYKYDSHTDYTRERQRASAYKSTSKSLTAKKPAEVKYRQAKDATKAVKRYTPTRTKKEMTAYPVTFWSLDTLYINAL
jgi:PBP1b-binding outer membrane lipoprotein LpoB